MSFRATESSAPLGEKLGKEQQAQWRRVVMWMHLNTRIRTLWLMLKNWGNGSPGSDLGRRVLEELGVYEVAYWGDQRGR